MEKESGGIPLAVEFVRHPAASITTFFHLPLVESCYPLKECGYLRALVLFSIIINVC